MDKIKNFNLELILFHKELTSYIQNVNKIDDETNHLMIKIVLAVDKLQINSQFREIPSFNENQFAYDLNDEIFQSRRYIVCRLCHENFPSNSEDFEAHIQKRRHKEAEEEMKLTRLNTKRASPETLNDSKAIINCEDTKLLNRHGEIASAQKDKTIETVAAPSTSGSVNGLELKAASSVNSASNNSSSSSSSSDSSSSSNNNNTNNNSAQSSRESSVGSGNVAMKLEDMIKTEEILHATTTGIIDLLSRTEERIRNEGQIMESIKSHLKVLDSKLLWKSFGSSTYGFGGSNTNFNVLVNTGGTEQKPFVLLRSLNEKLMNTADGQNEFELFAKVCGNRVQKAQFQMIHKKSRIACWIQFGFDFELAESSQIIRNCIDFDPLCYHLIAYVRSWQNAVNEIASKNGITGFQFNTYIISVLVIFFLQMNFKFPKLKELPPSKSRNFVRLPMVEKERLKLTIPSFFEFYAKKLSKIMCIDIGWQDRNVPAQQKRFSPEQISLRDGINANPDNWDDCGMYVHDIKSPGLNITAEISKEQVNNFKKMCQMFYSNGCHEKWIDEYMTKLHAIQLTKKLALNPSLSGSNASLNSVASSVKSTSSKTNDAFSVQSLKTAIGSIENNMTNPGPSASTKLENLIKVENVFKSIKTEMDNILSRSANRIQAENTIIQSLSTLFRSKLDITPFGSATYGFGGTKTDFNILINASLEILLNLMQSFIAILPPYFDVLGITKKNRVQSLQLKVIHRSSRIQCVLHFDASGSTAKTAEIIRGYMTLTPICKELIAYIRAWHNIVNDVAAQNGLVAFQFNTYIISVLVLFFLRVNHKLPTTNQLSSMVSDNIRLSLKGDVSQFAKEFFEFYKRLEISKHVIALNVGKWQERDLQPQQTQFSDEQKRLRNAIKANPQNWENCAVYVQDLVSPGLNVTAEISRQEITNFKLMCQLFSSYVPPKLNVEKPVDITSDQHIFTLINEEIEAVLHHMNSGLGHESKIISTLTKYIHEIRPSLKIVPFGSSQYIKRSKTNLNFLIDTDGGNPKDVGDCVFHKLEKTDIHLHFKDIQKIDADRVLRKQFSLTHIKSGLRCLLLFESDSSIAKSSDIIGRFVEKEPMCVALISFVSAWQTVLNRKGKPLFEFNKYIISVLVIFFLQMNNTLPTADKIESFTSNSSLNITKFKALKRQFFEFYGNRYQMWNHVISANLGRWQERRVQSSQKHFSEAQQRLRQGIETSPENWTDCTMYVQDLVRPNINITAEIKPHAAENFQKMCQKFAKIAPK